MRPFSHGDLKAFETSWIAMPAIHIVSIMVGCVPWPDIFARYDPLHTSLFQSALFIDYGRNAFVRADDPTRRGSRRQFHSSINDVPEIRRLSAFA